MDLLLLLAVTDEVLETIADELRAAESLSLLTCRRVSSAGLVALAESGALEGLLSCNLGGLWAIDNASIIAVVRSAKVRLNRGRWPSGFVVLTPPLPPPFSFCVTCPFVAGPYPPAPGRLPPDDR